ncbi:MAG: tetratricopeptide repeat protein, partial [Bacteroidia bacterium]
MKVFTFTFFLYLLSSFAFSQRMEQEMDSLLNVLQKQQPDSTKVHTYLSLAQINSISNIENSLKWAESGLNLATQLQYKKGIVACSNELGYGYSITGNNEKALTYLTNALNIAENQGLWLEIIDIHNSLGMIFGKKEEYEKALAHFRAALKSGQEHNLSRETAIGYNNVGLLLSKQGQYVLALDHFLAAEQLYEKA